MKKWEYTFFHFKCSIYNDLNHAKEELDICNKLGKDEWELVSSTSITNSTGEIRSILFTFKRPIEE